MDEEAKGTERTEKSVQKNNRSLSEERKAEAEEATLPGNGIMSWSVYEEEVEANLMKSKNNEK